MFKKIFIIGIFTYYIFSSSLIAKDTIIVSIEPQKYFIEQIAKDNFNIKIIVESGIYPSVYVPKTNQTFWMDTAQAYFSLDVPFEKKWLKAIDAKSKKIKIFDMSKNIKKYKNDPHIWLDPSLVRIQAKNILNALIELDPKNKKLYKKNYFTFVNKISRLDFQIRTLFKKAKRKTFTIFHPSLGYFAKRYGLEQVYIDMDPLIMSQNDMVNMVSQINEHNARLAFVPRFFPKLAEEYIYENTNAIVVPINPLAYNWMDNLLNIAKTIANLK